MIELAFPWALLLLPAPWLVWRFLPPHRDRQRALRVPFFRMLTEAAGVEARHGAAILSRTWLQRIAAALVWVLLVLALARPERLGEPIVTETAARDVILAIDISGSMDERDYAAPDGTRTQRLEAVKQVVDEFIAARDGDRVALIVFGSKAFVQAPFTADLATVQALLEGTEVGMAGPHTVIGDAIGLAIRTFEGSEIEQRLLILLSDGADTGSRMSPVNAAEIAAREEIEIFTIGVGNPDGTGENRVDRVALEEIARRSGGQSFFAGDAAALAAVYARIDEMVPRAVEVQSFRPRNSLAWPLLALAALIGLGATLVLHLRSLRRAAS